jgi:signal transduction histidine kinase
MLTSIELQELLIMSGSIYILSFLVTYAISRRFSSDITKLTMKVQEMAAGNFSAKVETGRKDEIGQLVNAINELMTRLKTGVALDVHKHKEINQAKTDFVALASHQLRTPLSIIKWYVDFLLSGDAGAINDDQKRYMEQVYKSNERLIELVNALLDVSRIDLGTFSIEPEPTNIIEKAEAAIAECLPEIKAKKLKVKKRFDDLPPINLDPRLTKIVFGNLLSNAVKYTPENGNIEIDIKKAEPNILIKVLDTGCGIPKDQQPQIFTKLFRADNVKKMESIGTGLGLYIVKAVIEKSGGKIWFESPCLDLLMAKGQKSEETPLDKKNQGTAFYITIPLKGMKKKPGTKKLSA